MRDKKNSRGIVEFFFHKVGIHLIRIRIGFQDFAL